MDVPVEYQDDDFSCTPVCVSMVLKYIRDKFEVFPEISFELLAQALKTSADLGGTTFENIQGINSLFIRTRPSLEIVPQFSQKFSDIIEQIKKEKVPVIAWIMMPDPNGDWPHSIVITDVDEEKLLIYCNDPVYGKQEIPTTKFMDMWNGCLRILIKFQVGRR